MFKLIVKVIHKTKEVYKRRGICYCGYALIKRIQFYTAGYIQPYLLQQYYSTWQYFCERMHSPRTFEFQGNKYRYFCKCYNKTWTNERTIEVPIIWKIVKENSGKRILEIGNVLSHYYPIKHDILDKYEQAKEVINEDIVDFETDKKYDLIVSISTLEHIGWDEKIRTPKKTLRAVEKMKHLLAEGGKLVVTSPLGYNHDLDYLLKTRELKFDKVSCMKRISKNNTWTETTWAEIKNMKYAEPYPYANGLFIGIIEK